MMPTSGEQKHCKAAMIAQERRESKKVFSAVFRGPQVKASYNLLDRKTSRVGRRKAK